MKDSQLPSALDREAASFNRRALLVAVVAALLLATAFGALFSSRGAAAQTVAIVALIGFVLVVATSALVVMRRIVRPARELAQAMTLMAHGDHDVRVRPSGAPEVSRMGVAF